MRLMISILLLATGSLNAQWEQLPDMPGPAREHAVSFVIDDDIFVGTGIGPDGGVLNDWWRFSTTAEEWHPVSDMPAAGRYGAAAFALLGNGYVIGGSDGTGALNETWRYQPDGDLWVLRAALPAEARYHAVAVEGLNVGILATGMFGNGSPTAEAWKYYPTLDQWEPIPSLTAPARYMAALTHTGSELLVTGGLDADGNVLNDAWIYATEIETGFWQPATAPPMALHGHKGTGRAATVIGGTSADGILHDEVWGRYGGQWNALAPFAGGARTAAVAAGVITEEDVDVYFGFGLDQDLVRRNDWWKMSRPVGIRESVNERLSLYPNPASNLLQITGVTEWNGVPFMIHDPVGRVVLTGSINGTTTINVASLAPGRYIMTLDNGERHGSAAFIKLPE